MARKKKKAGFSVAKAVKANARERVGQDKPARVLPEKPAGETRHAKHRDSAAALEARGEFE